MKDGSNAGMIRPATLQDLPTLVAMRDDLNALELRGSPHAPIQKLSVPEFSALWGPTLNDPDYCWRLVVNGAEPVGFGLIYILKPALEPTGAFIHWAYLKPSYRRHGLGRLLVEHLFSWAREKKACRVELQFIEGNESARQFWARLGFRPYAQKCVHYFDRLA